MSDIDVEIEVLAIHVEGTVTCARCGDCREFHLGIVRDGTKIKLVAVKCSQCDGLIPVIDGYLDPETEGLPVGSSLN